MPRTQQNFITLRQTLSTILGNQKHNSTDSKIPELLARLGLEDYLGSTSKREHLSGAVEAASDEQCVVAAQRVLSTLTLPISERDELQELVWDDGTTPDVPARFRREMAKNLESLDLALDRQGFEQTLSELWRVDELPGLDFLTNQPTLRQQIIRYHLDHNDWRVLEVFDKLGAFHCSHPRFCRFVEALASSRVRPDEPAQRMFIEAVDTALQPCGVMFFSLVGDDGYLTVKLFAIGGKGLQSPKNLIFASSSKPKLRLGNALDNDIEVVSGAEDLLMYDRPVGASGLLWRDLQSWYAQTHGLTEEDAKTLLYQRLKSSLPSSSPPQSLAFTSFYKAFAPQVPNLPALLPEVWFHWDPLTVKQRGKSALLRSRMDFLLLLPAGVRIVIEVDGKHHYSNESGRADPARYSDMMAADRALRLAGYEVYRFGAEELSRDGAQEMLIEFYRTLFKSYSLAIDK
jgi:very-short-patch-repair endonuclease